jgi:hypothetical protein
VLSGCYGPSNSRSEPIMPTKTPEDFENIPPPQSDYFDLEPRDRNDAIPDYLYYRV